MKICFCSLLLPNEEELLSKTKAKLSFSRHKFGLSVLEGLEENLKGNLTVMNIINTVNFPKYKQLIFKTQCWSHNKKAKDYHLGYVNLFVIKYLTQAFTLKRKLEKWIKQHPAQEKLILYVQDMYFPSIMAVLSVCKKYKNVKTCLMTGDLTGKYGLTPDSNPLKSKLILLKDKYVNKKIKLFDSFVLVTKYMANAMGVSDYPYTVMECLYSVDANDLSKVNNKNQLEKTLFYAGALREEYGIIHLLRAFSLIQDSSYRLLLAGGGEAVEVIKKWIKKDKRIKYLGFISPSEVTAYQEISDVLINPRTSEHEFVKYSFASKTMECLVSGKPYIAHKLPCNPPEYDAFIQYPENESDEALRDKMIEVCEMEKKEKDLLCEKSRKFIIEEKNPKKQCEKIVKMLKKI